MACASRRTVMRAIWLTNLTALSNTSLCSALSLSLSLFRKITTSVLVTNVVNHFLAKCRHRFYEDPLRNIRTLIWKHLVSRLSMIRLFGYHSLRIEWVNVGIDHLCTFSCNAFVIPFIDSYYPSVIVLNRTGGSFFSVPERNARPSVFYLITFLRFSRFHYLRLINAKWWKNNVSNCVAKRSLILYYSIG